MGRKIPGKKHKTIKDPYKQKQKRFESVRFKINNPPSNCDEQPIPKSLLRIMELKEKTKQKVSIAKPKKKQKVRKSKEQKQLTLPSIAQVLDKEPFHKGMTKPDKFIPKLVQKPNESHKSFLRRVELMTQNLINEVEFEKKFGVEIKKNPVTGEVVEVKNCKKKNIKSKKKKLNEKRKEKLMVKKENIKNIKDFSQLKDNIEFGEVVHRPPNLPPLKKLDKNEKQDKKLRYSSLLLNNMVDNKEAKSKNKMSDLEKQKSENERKFIVEAYRAAKKKS